MARATRIVAMFLDTALGMMKTTPMRRVVTYMIHRPYSSLRGAKIIGPGMRYVKLIAGAVDEAYSPIPNPTTNSVMVSRLTSSETPNVSPTPPISAVMTEEANATTKQTDAIISVHHHL